MVRSTSENSANRGNPRQSFRYDPDKWARFKALAGDQNASKVLQEFVDWFIGEPRSRAPQRPKRPEATTPDPQ